MQEQKPIRKRKKKRRLRKPIRIFLWCMAGSLCLYTANLGVKALGAPARTNQTQTIAKTNERTLSSSEPSASEDSNTIEDHTSISDSIIHNSQPSDDVGAAKEQSDSNVQDNQDESQEEQSSVQSSPESASAESSSSDQDVVQEANAATIGINDAVIDAVVINNEPASNENAMINTEPKIETIATILVDAGHGGIDPGMTLSDENGNVTYMEKDVTLKAAQEFKNAMAMINPAIRVELTRDSDTSTYTDMATYSDVNELNNRMAMIGQTGANYYLSLHCNSGNPSFSGVDLFIKPNDEFSSTLADQVFSAFDAIGWSESKQVTTVDQYPLHVVTLSPVPSMLVEMGYMTNETDLAKLLDDQQRNTLMQQLAAAYSEMILSRQAQS
ncbi:N-acetylmuramoyl-L-alanine amidase [Erysipelotrichaceae bacterium RD49]|nr:N-acetylmuramoyl-L-alanine amidase [Erysipelotrichaceae bacterium RD49]